jgi:hypothetical protein
MTSDYHFGGHYTMNFDELCSKDEDDKRLLFCWGIQAGFRMELPQGYNNYVYLEGEEPIGFQSGKLPHERDEPVPWDINKWDMIVHPHSPSVSEYLNDVYKTSKFVPILNPVHSKWYNPDIDKKHTVAYCGGTHDDMLKKFVHTLRKFPDSVHISHWPHLDGGTATHSTVTDAERMQIMNETKISVIKNSHFGNYSGPVRNLPDWEMYNWAKHIDINWVPHLKGRVSDSCIGKCLMLVHKDPWNEIQHFFTPDEHFIYFTDENDLENKITEILEDWDNYKQIAQNSHDVYMQKWTSEAFYDRLLKQFDK